LVVPGRNGWLVPAGSIDALVDGLREILDAPLEQLAEMGLHGREDVRRQHSSNEIGRGMLPHFRAAIDGE
jgi:glycosyltransferase involved in cell wall biosynthesis